MRGRGTVVKRCKCARNRWGKCPHPWTARWRDPNGSQREKSFATQQEANDHLTHIQHSKRSGEYVDPQAGKIRFRAYGDHWLKGRITIEDSSREIYESYLRNYIYPVIGNKQLKSVGREDVKAVISTMLANGRSARTIQVAAKVMSSIFKEAVRDRKIPKSPYVDIELPPIPAQAQFYMPTTQEIMKLADAMPSEMRLVVIVMAGCGLRLGEALALNKACLRDGNRTLRISEQVPTNEVRQTKPLKHRKAGEYRDVPLPSFVYEEIERHLAEHGTSDDGYLFRGRTRFLSQDVYRDHFRPAREAAGLPEGFRSHDLRHYFASIALHKGIPITEVSTWLGHRDIRITHMIYGHMVPSAFDRARSVLDAAWEGESQTQAD